MHSHFLLHPSQNHKTHYFVGNVCGEAKSAPYYLATTSSAGRGGGKQRLSAQAGRELLLHAPAAPADEVAATGGPKAAEDFAGGQAIEPRLGRTSCRSGQRGKELAKRGGLCSC